MTRTIEYRVQFTGATGRPASTMTDDGTRRPEVETIRVQARNINSGYPKALRRALEPLGSGLVREVGAIEFSQVVA